MWNNKGFSLVETLAACSIFFTLMFTFIPISYQLKTEEHILAQRRAIQSDLFNELQIHLQTNSSPSEQQFDKKVGNTRVSFYFVKEEAWWKGCSVWKNIKKDKEDFCLYGYSD